MYLGSLLLTVCPMEQPLRHCWKLRASPWYMDSPLQKQCCWNRRAWVILQKKLGGTGNRFLLSFSSTAQLENTQVNKRGQKGVVRAPHGGGEAMPKRGAAPQAQQLSNSCSASPADQNVLPRRWSRSFTIRTKRMQTFMHGWKVPNWKNSGLGHCYC